MKKLFAIILTVAMMFTLASTLTACTDKDDSSASSASDTATSDESAT